MALRPMTTPQGVQEGDAFLLGDRLTPGQGQGLGSSRPHSQGIVTVPLRQRLQSMHRKRFPLKYWRNWFFLQPHTVSWLTVQGESSTWNSSGKGRRWGVSPASLCHVYSTALFPVSPDPSHHVHLCIHTTNTGPHEHTHSCPHPQHYAHTSHDPQVPPRLWTRTRSFEPLPSPEPHLSDTWSS